MRLLGCPRTELLETSPHSNLITTKEEARPPPLYPITQSRNIGPLMAGHISPWSATMGMVYYACVSRAPLQLYIVLKKTIQPATRRVVLCLCLLFV